MAKISDIPLINRPRERALRYGVNILNDTELLALILSTGIKGKSVLEISSDILTQYHSLNHLSKENLTGLMKIDGIDKIKAIHLLAIFELHNRLLRNEYSPLITYSSPSDIYLRYQYLSNLDKENLILIILNNQKRIIKEINLSKGNKNKVVISYSDILKELLIADGKSFILLHNHPSENYYPSMEDILVTSKIKNEIKRFGINLIDHIIITNKGYFSFLENGKLDR